MPASLLKIVNQIQNHLSGGLRGQGNYTYSLEQIADEFVQKRAEVLVWLESQGKPEAISTANQRIDGLIIKPADWSASSVEAQQILNHLPVPAHRLEWHKCTIPQLLDLSDNPVVYLGPVGRPESWNVVRRIDELEFQESRRLKRRAPLCFADGNDLWITGRNGRLPQILRMDAVFADFREPFQLGLSPDEYRIVTERNEDQTATVKREPVIPLSDEASEKAKMRVLNLFLGTHSNRPITSNDGTAII